MAVLPWRPLVSVPATCHSGTPRVQHPAAARWHPHLHGLATAIHEISGLVHHMAQLVYFIALFDRKSGGSVCYFYLN